MRTEQDIACLEDHGIKLLTDASASGEYISRIFHWKGSTQIPNANQIRIPIHFQKTRNTIIHGKKGQ